MGYEEVCIYVQDSYSNRSVADCNVDIMPVAVYGGGGPVVITPTDPQGVTATWNPAK